MEQIYITRRLPDEGLHILQKYDLEIYEGDAPPSKKEILRGIQGKDALISLLTDPIDKEVIDASPQLQIIANYAAGVDNIDISRATQKGIWITNTPGVLTETTADLTWALILSIARRIIQGDDIMRQRSFKGWAPKLLLGQDVHKKTLGIIGMGKIGRAVARRAAGFDMSILYHNRTRDTKNEKKFNASFVDLETLLSHSDFITLHVPLTSETYHLIGRKEFKMMKKSAYLINTSRGKCVHEAALLQALSKGWIQGAALDVFEHEPQISSQLVELPNIVLAPHIGSASHETRGKMAIMAAENVIAAFRNEIPPNCVNLDVLKKRV
jgi:glyoxylate reductase